MQASSDYYISNYIIRIWNYKKNKPFNLNFLLLTYFLDGLFWDLISLEISMFSRCKIGVLKKTR
jgi:hypothetical protein